MNNPARAGLHGRYRRQGRASQAAASGEFGGADPVEQGKPVRRIGSTWSQRLLDQSGELLQRTLRDVSGRRS